MKNFSLKLFGGLVLATLVLISCSKDETESVLVDQQLMKASADIDFSNETDFSVGMEAATENSSFSNRDSDIASRFPACADITVNNTTPGVFPKIITIAFHPGCVHNGVLRSGTLTITLSGYLMSNGTTMTIERSNYFVNGRHVEGTVTYVNQTTNPETPQWTRTVTDGRITNIAGDVFTHSGTRTVRQMEGAGTLALGDNVYHIISGTHTVNRPNGSSLTVTVLETLIKRYSCNYISKGKLTLLGSYLDGVLDYGNDTCDNQATYTHSNGQVFNINL
ncbi:hypothetical protein [Flavobacterium pedocola]